MTDDRELRSTRSSLARSDAERGTRSRGRRRPPGRRDGAAGAAAVAMAAQEALDHEPNTHPCHRRGGSRPGRRRRPLAHQIRRARRAVARRRSRRRARRPSEASPSASPAAATVPEELRYQWLGEVVDAAGLPSGRDRAILTIGASTFELASDPVPLLASDVPSAEGNALRLVSHRIRRTAASLATSASTPGPCPPRARCSSSPRRVTTALRVAPRSRATWQRSACRNPDNNCLGDLEAGTYKSQFIGPRLDDGEPWTANFGAFSYTVPDGWSNTADFPDDYVLMRSADYAVATDPKDGTKDLIEIVARPGIGLQNEQCEPLVKPKPRVEARQPAFAQVEPRLGIRPDDDAGERRRVREDAGLGPGQLHLPARREILELDPIGRSGSLLGAQVALGQGVERLARPCAAARMPSRSPRRSKP